MAAVDRPQWPVNGPSRPPTARPTPARAVQSAIPSTWRNPTARTLVGSPRRAPHLTLRGSAYEWPRGSPPGGCRDGTASHPGNLPARRGHEHFVPNADAGCWLLTPGVVVCHVACVFLPVRLGPWRRFTGSLRFCSAKPVPGGPRLASCRPRHSPTARALCGGQNDVSYSDRAGQH